MLVLLVIIAVVATCLTRREWVDECRGRLSRRRRGGDPEALQHQHQYQQQYQSPPAGILDRLFGRPGGRVHASEREGLSKKLRGALSPRSVKAPKPLNGNGGWRTSGTFAPEYPSHAVTVDRHPAQRQMQMQTDGRQHQQQYQQQQRQGDRAPIITGVRADGWNAPKGQRQVSPTQERPRRPLPTTATQGNRELRAAEMKPIMHLRIDTSYETLHRQSIEYKRRKGIA
ncbi:hypothetical protein HK101_010429 [Irineochytrium annulatum]|nr:hypothetical protein HK101_010429 [Irineochytrium annulatum]